MNSDLIGELLQGLTQDVTSVKKSLAAQPHPQDYGPALEKLTASVLNLQQAVAKSAAASNAPTPAVATPMLDASVLEQQLRRAVAEEIRRYHPDRPLTQAVRYGIWVFIGVLGLLCLSWFGWWNAAQVRDHYARSNWFWRYTQQTSGAYAANVLASWRQDSASLQQRIEQAEAAELLRLQAQRKREEAATLEAQAAQSKRP
ncbi:hypothetical protein [Hymenobacter defluvii]|uniref:Uncharacterized protein n=1 Tax=Hymenobacter defluvii TaxID=2054411 RepID=A0ABS3THY4_9BACT|nr:hypothetical protein [Hymenobacter defluvii]MBO3273271.1 hypothetical protein [Hymenobacter defluvii]